MNRKRLAILLATVALLGTACGNAANDAAAQAQTISLTAFDFYFEDTALLMEPGASVTLKFTNNGDNLHSFTLSDWGIEVEADGGETVDTTFTVPETPGSYDFLCKYHPDEMQGTVSVGGADQPVDQPDATTTDDGDIDVEVDVEEES